MITPPIFIIEGWDIGLFASIEDARSHLEAIDVKNNIYVAYDSEGRLLTLSISKEKKSIFFGLFKIDRERIIIQEAENEPNHKNELRTVIIGFLKSSGMFIESLENISLKKLISKVITIKKGFD